MDPWKRRFLLEAIIFRLHVSFRGGTPQDLHGANKTPAASPPQLVLIGRHRQRWRTRDRGVRGGGRGEASRTVPGVLGSRENGPRTNQLEVEGPITPLK